MQASTLLTLLRRQLHRLLYIVPVYFGLLVGILRLRFACVLRWNVNVGRLKTLLRLLTHLLYFPALSSSSRRGAAAHVGEALSPLTDLRHLKK